MQQAKTNTTTAPKLALSPDQQEAVDHIGDAARRPVSERRPAYLLAGSAGSGKTTTTRAIVDRIEALGMTVALTASTNKAARVLGDATGREAKTLHSLLNLQPKRQPDGSVALVQTKPPMLDDIGVIVVDEASMVDTQLLKFVMRAAQAHAAMVLFIGDGCQLPPVASDPRVFDPWPHIEMLKLTRVHRQAVGSPVLDLAIGLRDVIQGRRATMPQVESLVLDNGDGIKLTDAAEFEALMVEAFKFGDDGSVRVLAYTNARVRHYNQLIRRARYGAAADAHAILSGEPLVTTEPIMRNGQVVLSTDAAVMAESTVETYDAHGVPGTHVDLSVRGELGLRLNVSCFVPSDWDIAAQVSKRLRATAMEATKRAKASGSQADERSRKAAWSAFFEAVDGWTDLRPPYASTVHRAQGSTFRTAFVDLPNLLTCRDSDTKARLIYTAVTRVSSLLVALGEVAA